MPTEEQLLEIHRLAVLGRVAAIAQDVTDRLANAWTGVSRFREVQDLCLKTLELGHTPLTLSLLAKAKTVLGEVEEAMQLYRVVLNMYEEAGDRVGLATTLSNIGAVYDRMGQPAQALAYYHKALPFCEAVGDRVGLATTLSNIGLVYRHTGRPAQALAYYQQALPLREAVSDRAGESVTRYNLAQIYRDQGKLREAVEELRQVVALDKQVHSPDLESDSVVLAQVEAELGLGG